MLITVLAGYRIARVVATDTITANYRERVARWAYEIYPNGEFGAPKHRIGQYYYGLISCEHCFGFWACCLLWFGLRWGHIMSMDIWRALGIAGTQSFLVSFRGRD